MTKDTIILTFLDLQFMDSYCSTSILTSYQLHETENLRAKSHGSKNIYHWKNTFLATVYNELFVDGRDLVFRGYKIFGSGWLLFVKGKNFNDVLLKQHKIRNFNTFKLFVWYTSVRELHDGCHQIFRVKENAMSKNCFPKFASGEFHLTWVQFSLAIFFVLELMLADRK